MRPRGFMDNWKPKAETETLINQVQEILVEYRAYLPMTIRQIFYRLVGAYGYPKDEKAYKRLQEHIGKARRARLIPFRQIRDDGFSSISDYYDTTPEGFVASVKSQARHYRLDPQSVQATKLFVWCEAGGMTNQLASVANPYGVSVLSSGGFDSLTVKYDLAQTFSGFDRVKVFHIGDHDPSGVHIFSSLEEDIVAFMEGRGTEIGFVRLAVLHEHIERYSLPTAPPKATDKRSFDGETVQAEALPPDILCGILSHALAEQVDTHAANDLKALEAEHRATLLAWTETL